MESPARELTLEDLDAGGFARALCEPLPQSYKPEALLWTAELHAYEHRLEDAEAVLAQLPDLPAELKLRARCLVGEIAHWRHQTELAETIAAEVEAEAIEIGDTRHALRAQLLSLRAMVRSGRFSDALISAPRVRDRAQGLGIGFWHAIATHCLAYARLKVGDSRGVLPLIDESIARFEALETRRWSAFAHGLRAMYFNDIGDNARALEHCETQEQIAAELGIIGDMLYARHNAAAALVALRRYGDAITSLQNTATESAEWGVQSEMSSLELLSLAYLMTGRRGDARDAAERHLELARATDTQDALLSASTILAWLDGGVERLRDLCHAATEFELCDQLFRARILLADLLVELQLDEASRLVELAMSDPRIALGDPFRRLGDDVQAKLRTLPVRVVADTVFQCDLTRGFPDYTNAVQTFERWLLEKSLEAAAGRKSTAARLLGITRSRYGDRWNRAVLNIPTRPVKRSLRDEQPEDVDDDVDNDGEMDRGRGGPLAAGTLATPTTRVNRGRKERGQAKGQHRRKSERGDSSTH